MPEDALALFVAGAALVGRRYKHARRRRAFLEDLHRGLVDDLVAEGLDEDLATARADLVVEAVVVEMQQDRGGKLLRAMEKSEGGRPSKTAGNDARSSEYREAINAAGLSEDQAKRWQQFSDVPDEIKEAAYVAPEKPSRAVATTSG